MDFFVFDAESKRIAVNRTKMNYCQFLFDVAGVIDTKEQEGKSEVVVHFADTKEPVRFEAEPDTSEMLEDEEGSRSQLQNLFLDVEGASAESEQLLWFDDVDGERVYIRAKQVLSIEVPLICCEPALWRNYLDHFEESDAAVEPDSTRSEQGVK